MNFNPVDFFLMFKFLQIIYKLSNAQQAMWYVWELFASFQFDKIHKSWISKFFIHNFIEILFFVVESS